LAVDFGDRGMGELFRSGQEDRRRGRAVLGLTQQVGCAHLGVRGVVGDDQNLGRAGEEVDADPAIELPLGLGDIGVAGPDQHVHRLEGRGAERHRRDCLNAAENMDFIGAA
jgi:hypothetical protein